MAEIEIEKTIEGLKRYLNYPKPLRDVAQQAITLLKEQEDHVRNLIADFDDLRKEHDRLLDKKIPLITNGQEVVRCKDCKKRYTEECGLRMTYMPQDDMFYCAAGRVK